MEWNDSFRSHLELPLFPSPPSSPSFSSSPPDSIHHDPPPPRFIDRYPPPFPSEQFPAVPFDIPFEYAPIERPGTWKKVDAVNVEGAVQYIVSYLADTSEPSQDIYFDGWGGLGASWVLTCVAEDPPPSVRNIFAKIIHIDCSRWKNRRELQRIIVQKLGLPQQATNILDKQDEEDDFIGSDEGSRVEIKKVGQQIHQALRGQSFLVVFRNGSSNPVNLNNFGIPQPEDQFPSFVRKVLWTFRGRLRGLPGMKKNVDKKLVSSRAKSTKSGDQPVTDRVDNSKIYLYSDLDDSESKSWNKLVHEEAAELAQYTRKPGVTKEVAALCCKYMLLLNSKGVDTIDFNWATHASSYWVCDGLMQEYQQDKAWEVATALLEEIRLEDFSSFELPDFGDKTRWIVASDSNTEEINPETTSFFWGNKRRLVVSLPNNMFQRCDQLHVLKLCFSTFSFSSPPFLCCQSIRFLGLDHCKDQPQKVDENKEAEEENDRRKIEFLQSLLVLDVSYTDWEFNLSLQRSLNNIREINIKRGRTWSSDHGWTWRHLHNIHKLRVIEPTSPWETDNMEEFRDMVKLELLDLSGNSTIQVLPSLSGTTSLSTLVLDGCIGLTDIGAEALPPSLITFSFDAGVDSNKKANISHISMAACARLVNFKLCGSLPNLEELDLSNTSIKTIDLRDETVHLPCLQRVILLGCQRLHAILWPKDGMPKIMLLRIDTRGGMQTARSKEAHDSLVNNELQEYGCASVSVTDMRFLQSLVLASANKFCCNISNFNLNISFACTGNGQTQSNKGMGFYSAGLVGPPQHKSSIPNTQRIYSDVNSFDKTTMSNDGNSVWQFQPLDLHLEIGKGVDNTNVVTEKGIRAVIFLMNRINSLLVHDNSFITTVISERMMSIGKEEKKKSNIYWSSLKRCHIERCSKLEAVFATNYDILCFRKLVTFSAADLLMAQSIWSKGRLISIVDDLSFAKLQAIHLQFCPRLTFVLPLSWFYTLSSLEILHIVHCGDLSQVFPVEAEFLGKLSTDHRRGVLEFPKLKHIYLHELPKLHQICEAKMFAPELETFWVRGCWSLKRLPATTDRPDCRPIVDCEKDWWDKLEWDGKEALHHHSLFEPRHSKYYRKKNLLRGTVLR